MAELPVPVGLEKTGDRKLLISWDDGVRQLFSAKGLRDQCPCATCIDSRILKTVQEARPDFGQLPVLSEAQARPLEITKMQPVGNYAYNIQFSDEHSTGIYTFDFLRSLESELDAGD